MYKVFLNDRIISIGESNEITIKHAAEDLTVPLSSASMKQWFLDFSNNKKNRVFLLHENKEHLFSVFRSIFINMEAAGGVIYHGNRVLFIFRNGKWDLPKGKVEPGETSEYAALREVQEETGLKNHEIIKPLPSTWHLYRSPTMIEDKEWILKRTRWYEMEIPQIEPLKLQSEEGITHAKWVSIDDLKEIENSTFESLKGLINLYRS